MAKRKELSRRPGRVEAMEVNVKPGDNAKILRHNLKLFTLETMSHEDMADPQKMLDRIQLYFETCANDDIKPCVEGLCLAFGVDHQTFRRWANGIDCDFLSDSSRIIIKKTYALLNAEMATNLIEGKINPVAAFFLMKNHFGYADQTEVLVTPNQNLGNSVSAAELQKKYADSISDSGDFATLPGASDSGNSSDSD